MAVGPFPGDLSIIALRLMCSSFPLVAAEINARYIEPLYIDGSAST
jgi:hypothetical protein